MKKIITFVVLGMSISTMSIGGGHTEGGGNYLKTKIRDARIHAIWALKNITVELLQQKGAPEEVILLFKKVSMQIAEDLEGSPYQFYSAEKDRPQFVLEGEEKTFLTTHEPWGLIKINLMRCEQLNINLRGAAVQFMRDGSRHIIPWETDKANDIEAKLQKIEEMGLVVMRIYQDITGYEDVNNSAMSGNNVDEVPHCDAQAQAQTFTVNIINESFKKQVKIPPATEEEIFDWRHFITKDNESLVLKPTFTSIGALSKAVHNNKSFRKRLPVSVDLRTHGLAEFLLFSFPFHMNIVHRLENKGYDLKKAGIVYDENWKNWRGAALEIVFLPGRLVGFLFTTAVMEPDFDLISFPAYYRIHELTDFKKIDQLTLEEVFCTKPSDEGGAS